jgi:hypothetical protein
MLAGPAAWLPWQMSKENMSKSVGSAVSRRFSNDCHTSVMNSWYISDDYHYPAKSFDVGPHCHRRLPTGEGLNYSRRLSRL